MASLAEVEAVSTARIIDGANYRLVEVALQRVREITPTEKTGVLGYLKVANPLPGCLAGCWYPLLGKCTITRNPHNEPDRFQENRPR